MFSVLPSRLLSRLGAAVAHSPIARPFPTSSALSRAILASTTRRTFLTSARLSLPAASTKSAAGRKPAAKSPAKTTAKKSVKTTAAAAKPKKKPAPKKKVAAKKKVVPKKKKVVPKKKKVVVKKAPAKPQRITKAMGPPSRGGSPYIQFVKQFLANQGAGIASSPDRMRAAGAAWKGLSELEKQPYFAQSAAERAAQKQVYDKWVADADPAFLARLNKQRKVKKQGKIVNPNRVKRPMSAYFLLVLSLPRRFQQAHRKTLPSDTPFMEIGKICGALWKTMPASEKEVYTSIFKKNFEAYKAGPKVMS
ncbi:hypothetical protein DFH09DRAFT_1131871 [Mycena vulgaris]|nr:hypothetical protein DFH09DRAFT_1131871 [Mycena vulgaris]